MVVNIFSYMNAEQKKLEESLEAHRNQDKPVEEDSEYLDYLKTLKLEYEDGKTPPYENLDVQRYYILRYGFGYPYKYKCMYEKVLNLDRERFEKSISVLSIGCGALLDYLGLQYALKETGIEDCSIFYEGIEPIDWEDSVYRRSGDEVLIQTCRAEDFFSRSPDNSCPADVIIFPTSISEVPISDADDPENIEFKKFYTNLVKKIFGDDLYILTTIRKMDGISRSDLDRVEVIKDVMKENGYELKEEIEEQDEEMEDEITFPDSSDKESPYPKGIKDYLQKLGSECEDLNRNPVFKKTTTCYRVLHFVRTK